MSDKLQPSNSITPDRWLILKIAARDGTANFERILAGWSGGYLTGDSWRLSSPINSVTESSHLPETFEVMTESGSIYQLRKSSEGLNVIMAQVLSRLKSSDLYIIEEEEGWNGKI